MSCLNLRAVTSTFAATVCLIVATPAISQSTANPPTGPSAQASPTSTQAEASTPTSAQKKAARKANRQKKNAELSKLEKNGYNPANDDSNYPTNIQNAEKKAAGQ